MLIELEAFPGETFYGEVSLIHPQLSFRKATVDVSVQDRQGLLLGMRARAKIEIEQ